MKNIKTYISIILLIIATYFIYDYYFGTSISSKNNGQNINNSQVTNDTNIVNKYKNKMIIAFGDSLTAGYGVLENESYPSILEKKLIGNGYNVKIINSGVSGETSKGNSERAQFIADQKPDIVILGIGGNDALRGLGLSEMQKNIETTINVLQSSNKNLKIMLLQMQAPLISGITYKNNFDKVYKEVADKYNLTLTPFMVKEVFLDRKYMTSDGIHPNKDGYKLLVDEYINKDITKILKSL